MLIQISGNLTADGVDADQREKLLEDNRSKDAQETCKPLSFPALMMLPDIMSIHLQSNGVVTILQRVGSKNTQDKL